MRCKSSKALSPFNRDVSRTHYFRIVPSFSGLVSTNRQMSPWRWKVWLRSYRQKLCFAPVCWDHRQTYHKTFQSSGPCTGICHYHGFYTPLQLAEMSWPARWSRCCDYMQAGPLRRPQLKICASLTVDIVTFSALHAPIPWAFPIPQAVKESARLAKVALPILTMPPQRNSTRLRTTRPVSSVDSAQA